MWQQRFTERELFVRGIARRGPSERAATVFWQHGTSRARSARLPWLALSDTTKRVVTIDATAIPCLQQVRGGGDGGEQALSRCGCLSDTFRMAVCAQKPCSAPSPRSSSHAVGQRQKDADRTIRTAPLLLPLLKLDASELHPHRGHCGASRCSEMTENESTVTALPCATAVLPCEYAGHTCRCMSRRAVR